MQGSADRRAGGGKKKAGEQLNPCARDLDKLPADPGDRRGRIYAMSQLMAAGLWERGWTARQLCKHWGIPLGTVKGMSAEASHILDIVTNDKQTLLNLLRSRLLDIATQDDTDRVQAARTILEHLGELRHKHEGSVDLGVGGTLGDILAAALDERGSGAGGR